LGAVAGQARMFLDEVVRTTPPAVGTTDPDAIRRYAERIRTEAVVKQAELQKRIIRARHESVAAGATAGVGGAAMRDTATVLADHPIDADAPAASAVTVRAVTPATVGADLDRISADVATVDRDRLLGQAAAVMAATNQVRTEMLSDQLRHDIQGANVVAAEQVAQVQRAIDLLAQLPEGADDTLAAELQQVIARQRPLHADMADRVATAAQAAQAAADRRFAAAALADALDELGYDVQTGFATVAVQDGQAFFQHPDWPGYGVRWRLGADEAAMSFSVVDLDATDGTDEVRSVEVEDAWCGRIPELLGALRQQGVRFQLTRSLASGTVPIPVLDDVPAGLRGTPTAAPVRKRTAQQRRHP
ncbi:MAG TPA: hypothetical protein VMM13_18395, partial [Euzebya sp.]|nr:hypothetical protein [Euzebya sp.]